jgi:mannosyltransferase OCH1-like enzyme
MKIPRILHQTWKDHDVPEHFGQMSKTWRKLHANWDYVFWTDDMNRAFISEHFSYFLPVYDSYETNIQRVDAVRYFILYKYGGFFIDMDFECLANIGPLLGNAACIFGREPVQHCRIHDKSLIISNAFMGTSAGFHFFEQLCKELERKRPVIDHPNDSVLETTGPFMLSRLYEEYHRKEEICLLEANLLYPLTKEELTDLANGTENKTIAHKLKDAYGIHHYAGTWWKKRSL